MAASSGRVTLSGAVLAHEVEGLLRAISRVPGVQEVENRLEVHEQAGHISGLQGGSRRSGERFELMQQNWSPTARLLIGAVGAGLLLRAVTNRELKRLVGTEGAGRGVEIEKTINIAAPPARVFEFWSKWENFPRFMKNVREVRDLGNNRSHWVVEGPAGVPVEWDAVVSRWEPYEVLGWRSEPGSMVENAGIIRFTPNEDGSTKVEIRLSYNPPAGALGHLVAKLFGADAKSEMDQDLLRVKTLIEAGNSQHEAGENRSQAREASAS